MPRHLHGYDTLEYILEHCKVSLFQFFIYTEEVLGCGYKRKYPKELDIPRKVMIVQAFSLLGYSCVDIKGIIQKGLYTNKKWIDSLDDEYGIVKKAPIVREINEGTFDIDELRDEVNTVFDEYFDNYFLDMFNHNENTRITGYTLYDILEEFTRFINREFLDDDVVQELIANISCTNGNSKLMHDLEHIVLNEYNLPLSLVGMVLACDYKTWQGEKSLIKGIDNFRMAATEILRYSYNRLADPVVNALAYFYRVIKNEVVEEEIDYSLIEEAFLKTTSVIKDYIPRCKLEFIVKTLFVFLKTEFVEETKYQEMIKLVRPLFDLVSSDNKKNSLRTFEKPVLYAEEHADFIEQLHLV